MGAQCASKCSGKAELPRSVSASSLSTRATGSTHTSMSSACSSTAVTLVIDNLMSIRERYDVEREPIGVGSSGTVYRGTEKTTGAVHAVKTVSKRTVKNRARLVREIRTMKRLDHPNLLKLYETFEDGRSVHLVMELCAGGHLLDHIISEGDFSEVQAAIVMLQIIRSVHYMHLNRICHRDLRPEHFMLLSKAPIEENVLKIIDFGLSCTFEQGKKLRTKASTPYYVSPQALSGSYDQSCDLWSCGTIMYTLLCGHPPFWGETDEDIMMRVKRGKYCFPSKIASPDAEDLVRMLLKVKPRERYSAEQALNHPWIREFAPRAEKPSLPQDLGRNLARFHRANELKKVALNIIASQLSEDQISGLRNIFVALDTKQTGSLTVGEVQEGLHYAGLGVLPTNLKMVLESTTDQNGTVNYTKFLAASLDKKQYLREDICWNAFAVFDRDGDGRISSEELAHVLNSGSLREELVAFFQGTHDSSYAPQAGEITGILKELGDEMSAALAKAIAEEKEAVATFEALVAAKKKEIAAATAAIEKKSTRVGNLGVEIETMKVELSDTEEALIADKKFLAELKTDCDTKTAEWEEISANRAAEEVALADTIKILNDDDALDLFKKTLPAAGASFVQVQVTKFQMKAKAIAALKKGRAFDLHRPQIDFIMLAIRGQKIGFEKVITMIDDMVATLKTEQGDDDHKKEYCGVQFDQTEDKMKAAEQSLADTETSIADTTESIATVTDEIKATQDGIKALDKSVAEATALRKTENADFVELMAGDKQAKEILEFAKGRLNKFYNPKLYAATSGAAAFVQVAAHNNLKHDAAPGAPPPAPKAYSKSSSSGVIAMIDKIIADLDKEMQEATVSEKDAQSDYEELMADSAAKRASDSKSLTQLEGHEADLQTALEGFKAAKAAGTKELEGIKAYDSSLHAECDWLLKYYEVRKEARTGEIDSLEKAKAVLSGADYSLVQTRSRRFLNRA